MPLDRREDPDAMVCDDEVRTDEEEAWLWDKDICEESVEDPLGVGFNSERMAKYVARGSVWNKISWSSPGTMVRGLHWLPGLEHLSDISTLNVMSERHTTHKLIPSSSIFCVRLSKI